MMASVIHCRKKGNRKRMASGKCEYNELELTPHQLKKLAREKRRAFTNVAIAAIGLGYPTDTIYKIAKQTSLDRAYDIMQRCRHSDYIYVLYSEEQEREIKKEFKRLYKEVNG